MSVPRILIRNGHVIDTEPEPVALPNTDVLIEDGRIIAVGADLPADGATVIDATDKIVLPGFVDTHRHVWQSALRGAAVDVDLGAYLGILAKCGPKFSPQDVHTATLAGALECLDSGITTQLDYSHISYSPEHADAAIDALGAAGLRAVYGYGTPVTGGGSLDDVRRIRSERLSDDNALVTMAYAPLGPSFTPIETVAEEWRVTGELELPVTFHVSAGPVNVRPITALRDAGLLREKILYVHGNTLDDEELKLIADSGAAASAAPGAEAMLGNNSPVAGRLKRLGVTTGLGVDAVTSAPGDMFSLMRAALLASQIVDEPRMTCADVLKMATLDGAAALGLAHRTGSLRPGKQADIVLLRLDGINTLTAERDPIAAVVTSAHPHNVDTVLVAGQVVKIDGRLVHADLGRVTRELRETALTVAGH
ncbi:amidohydrolase family protein [Streptomyces sp. MB09-02B]|uniref:amidohydrolase family protein n=1 Tax=Streptomyces sp. MB09-02B TaxID=3028667 RepID=UPI0029BA82D1|nr:amidohydrolase family protein [Streptomyces sp. MB09-02B]MDX3640827.1 amidohydrolase family protein [Streptomyces sp. MB09-02B]